MLIAVDIGNSSTKVGWFGKSSFGTALPEPSGTLAFATGQKPQDDVIGLLPQEPSRWYVASVHREGTRILQAWLAVRRQHDEVRLLSHADLPIRCRVSHPDRVGLDRLAAAVAANVMRAKDRAAIVVDAGSAITVDLVASDGAFEGGVIMPGFRMSAEALDQADLLPLTTIAPNDEPPPVVGKSTELAIRSGLFWGAVGAVREIIDRIGTQLDQPPEIYVTGGDLRRLAEQLGDETSFLPNMVLSGIAVAAGRG